MFDPMDSSTEVLSSERIDAHRATARRVLKALFELEAQNLQLSDATTLADFAGVLGVARAPAWAIRVKEQVYAHFGIDCEVDEPLVDMLVRLESAEHGVRLVRQD